jgi:hypothetical protein
MRNPKVLISAAPCDCWLILQLRCISQELVLKDTWPPGRVPSAALSIADYNRASAVEMRQQAAGTKPGRCDRTRLFGTRAGWGNRRRRQREQLHIGGASCPTGRAQVTPRRPSPTVPFAGHHAWRLVTPLSLATAHTGQGERDRPTFAGAPPVIGGLGSGIAVPDLKTGRVEPAVARPAWSHDC